MPETRIRIVAEGGSQAKTEIDQAAGGLDRLGGSGGQAAGVLGQLGSAGGIVGAALGGAGMVAGVMAGKYALDQFAQSADTAYAAMSKLGGAAGANVNATYGPGGARMAAWQGVGYGVAGQEAVQARAGLLGTLGAGDRTEAANVEALRIGRLLGPGAAGQAAGAIGGFMAGNRGMSATGAGNLYWAAMQGLGGEGVGLLPQITSAGESAGFDIGESTAMADMLSKSGGSPALAIQAMRGLANDSPEVRSLKRRLGITKGMSAEQQLRRIKAGNLSGAQERTLFGAGVKGLSGLMENLDKFGAMASGYNAAAGGTTDLVGEYERTVASGDIMGQQVIEQRRFEALKEFAKTGKSLAPGQMASLVKDPGAAGDIIGAALLGDLKQDPKAYFGGVGAREARDTAAAIAKDDLQRQGK